MKKTGLDLTGGVCMGQRVRESLFEETGNARQR